MAFTKRAWRSVSYSRTKRCRHSNKCRQPRSSSHRTHLRSGDLKTAAGPAAVRRDAAGIVISRRTGGTIAAGPTAAKSPAVWLGPASQKLPRRTWAAEQAAVEAALHQLRECHRFLPARDAGGRGMHLRRNRRRDDHRKEPHVCINPRCVFRTRDVGTIRPFCGVVFSCSDAGRRRARRKVQARLCYRLGACFGV